MHPVVAPLPPPLHHPHFTILAHYTTPTAPTPLHRPHGQAWSLYLAPERPPLPAAKDFIVSELQSFANSSGGLFEAPASSRALKATTLHQYNFRPRDLQLLPQFFSTFEARFQVGANKSPAATSIPLSVHATKI